MANKIQMPFFFHHKNGRLEKEWRGDLQKQTLSHKVGFVERLGDV